MIQLEHKLSFYCAELYFTSLFSDLPFCFDIEVTLQTKFVSQYMTLPSCIIMPMHLLIKVCLLNQYAIVSISFVS